MADDGIYHGRLETDGNGNLLATDDEKKPVAYHDGSFIYLKAGEESHNTRHENQALEMTGTVDDTMTDDPSLVNAYEGGENAHHFDPPPADGAPIDPDAIAAKVTSHTDAWS